MKYISSSSYFGRAGRRRSADFALALGLGFGPGMGPWLETVGVVLALLLL